MSKLTVDAAEQKRLAEHRIRLLDRLRSFGASYTELTGTFAEWLGLHSTDAAALVEILYAEDIGAPLSPARLSKRVSLSSGATTTLLNRLERAGHVVRTREHDDRRVVTIRSSPQIAGPAVEFFDPLAQHLDAMLARYTTADLEVVEGFLDDLRSTMATVLADQPRR